MLLSDNCLEDKLNLMLLCAAYAQDDLGLRLIEQGIPVEGEIYLFSGAFVPNTTPLFACVEGGKDVKGKTIRLLLQKGAEIDRRLGKDRTVLITASVTGQVEAITALVEHGCDVNA